MKLWHRPSIYVILNHFLSIENFPKTAFLLVDPQDLTAIYLQPNKAGYTAIQSWTVGQEP